MILNRRRCRYTNAPLKIYLGKVVHCRHGGIKHKFSYKALSFALDIDRLDAANRMSSFLSVRRFNLFSFYPSDHMEHGYPTLRSYVQSVLLQADIREQPEKIILLAYPRFLGSAFNPISIFYCYRGDRLTAILYQVRNTFGDMHYYAVAISKSDTQGPDIVYKHSCPKSFHVSPFLDLSGEYHFIARPPTERVSLIIRLTQNSKPVLTASFDGKQQPVTSSSLLKIGFGYFQNAAKILGLIHWEALKLWIKGAKFHKRPAPPTSIVTSMHKQAPTHSKPNISSGRQL